MVNAGDADREELFIQEEIYKFAGNKKDVKVLWSQSFTEEEICKRFISILMPDYEYLSSIRLTDLGGKKLSEKNISDIC